jgi:hypothetical protein
MVQALRPNSSSGSLHVVPPTQSWHDSIELDFQLPNPDDDRLSEQEFQREIDAAWQVTCRPIFGEDGFCAPFAIEKSEVAMGAAWASSTG